MNAGVGNFASDGIHPSLQGYTWWGYHIAESILESNLNLLALSAGDEGGGSSSSSSSSSTK